MYLPFSVKITETEKKKKEKSFFLCNFISYRSLSLSFPVFFEMLVDESYLSWLLL